MNRSMDNLEQLSDSELRHRLLQYGFPNLPVTNTTRKILIKKLRNHINNEKAKLRRETKLITRYSSDEESDIDIKKRKGIASTSQQRSPTLFTNNNNNNNNNLLPPISILRRTTTVSPVQKTHKSYSTNGNSSSEKSTKSTIYIPPPIIVNDSDEESDCYEQTRSFNSSVKSPSVSSYTPSPSKYFSTSSDKLSMYDLHDSWFQNRYSTSPISYSSKISTDNTTTAQSTTLNNTTNTTTNHDSPYLSNSIRRLLNLRGETIRDSVNRNDVSRHRLTSHYQPSTSVSSGPDPADIVHQQPEPKSEQIISPNAAFCNLLNRLDEQYGVKQTLIPCVLLSTLVIFLSMVSFMYMTITPDLANTISKKNTIYSVCCPNLKSLEVRTSNYDCIEKDALDDTLELLKIIAPELQKRAEINQCIDRTSPYTLSAREVINLVQNHDSNNINVRQTIRNLYNLEYLIEKNPQWKIRHVNENGDIIDFNQVIQLRNTQSNHFAIKDPKLPFTCSLLNKFHKVICLVGITAMVLVGLSFIHFIYRLYANYQQSKREAVAYFIDEIINTLMKMAAVNPERNSIMISNLRDKLMPIHKRHNLEWAWNEALKFLEQNESRIQYEVCIKNGEEVKLMRWIDTVSPEQIGQRSQIKKWHSPAFDKTNKIENPPTPCLKIRQMFDKLEANNPNLKTIIQDAILEKVGPNCKIYDIQLDKATCCVYVRCATMKDAGIVHNEINGWWFDKRLVSIKFLRLERYLCRFPKSSSGPTCLRPSNTQNLSMSQCSRECGEGEYMSNMDGDDIDEDNDN